MPTTSHSSSNPASGLKSVLPSIGQPATNVKHTTPANSVERFPCKLRPLAMSFFSTSWAKVETGQRSVLQIHA
ncbi:hypothetical protein [Absidia glauca]|uniref:Uncharacterized protein n=1 Tax=Absidia glauca TaxID=4829 RepID=A0A168LU47_ABSGL|nr:hypothetical protein [Absidia glauca]